MYQIYGQWPAVRGKAGLAFGHHMRWKIGQSFDWGEGSDGLAKRHISHSASSLARRLHPATFYGQRFRGRQLRSDESVYKACRQSIEVGTLSWAS